MTKIKFDVVINNDDFEIDMKSGLETLQGISDMVRLIGEAILTDSISERKTHKNSIRTNLERNFKGSYGQIFNLSTYDDNLDKKLRTIGKDNFIDLLNFFIKESIYEDYKLISSASKIYQNLDESLVTELMEKIRSPLITAHNICKTFNFDITLRYRKYKSEPQMIQVFNKVTESKIVAISDDKITTITAAITRINIHTGNGRIQLKNSNETIAFGFAGNFKSISKSIKSQISSNLNNNMTIEDTDNWKYLELKVKSIKLGNGDIIKYIFDSLGTD